MGIELHTTAYGLPATTLLRKRIDAAKDGDPLRPVTVVVPTNSVGVSARRALASPHDTPQVGVIGLTLVTIYRLAELLGAPRLAATGRRPVSTPVIAAAVRRVLRDRPGVFAAVADHPSTEESLVRVHRELSDCSRAALTTLDELPVPRVSDVIRLHRQVRELLAEGWYDEADLMTAAREAIAERSPVLEDLGHVVVHLPQVLSLGAAALIRDLAGATDVEVVAASCGVEAADGDVRRSLARLGLSWPTATDVDAPLGTQVISVSDADEEVRTAVDQVLSAARRGVPLERIAVLYPTAQPYARIAHEQLAAAGVTTNGPSVTALADRLAGRWLLDVLELPDRLYGRSAVMDVLLGAPIRGRGGGRPPVSAWERRSREAGIVRGRGDWHDKLARLATELRARADDEAACDEPRQWLVERHRREAAQADGLRSYVLELFATLDRIARSRSWSAIADACQQLLARCLGDEDHRARHWPAAEAEAAQKVEAALERLRGLEELEPDTSISAFRRTLQLELDADLGRAGRLGEGVLVGPPSSALGVDLDVVIVLGLAEGVLPARVREDSLLADRERAVVADELPPRRDRVHVEHRMVLAALASAGDERVLVHPRGDLRRSIERAPSRWLLDTCVALTGDRRLPRSTTASVNVVPSFAGRLARVAFPATERQWRLRSLEDHRRAGRRPDEHPLADTDPAFTAGLRLLRARASRDFTPYDGDLARVRDQLPGVLAGHQVWSTTRLEAYVDCPHAYLARYVLRVEPLEDPEELLQISPLEKGSLVHDVLDRWLHERIAADEVPEPTRPWPAAARRRLLELAGAACDAAEDRGVTGHPRLWQRDRRRILADLERFLDVDDARRASQLLTPVATELSFGDGHGALEVPLGDGRSIALRGKIDRVDRAEPNGLAVTDYKTGRPYRQSQLDDDPVDGGTKLQLPVYAEAVRRSHGEPGTSVHASYWFVTERGKFDVVGYRVDDDVLERTREVLRTVVDGLAAARFPQRPAAPGFRVYIDCHYCDPDGLGTADRFRRWEQLRRHDDLRGYVALVEPDALADVTDAATDAEQLTIGDGR